MMAKTMIGSKMPAKTQQLGELEQSLKRQSREPRNTKTMMAKVPLPIP